MFSKLLLLIIAIIIIGLGLYLLKPKWPSQRTPVSTVRPAITTATKTPTLSLTPATSTSNSSTDSKPSAPLDIKLLLSDKDLLLNKEYTLTLRFTPRQNVTSTVSFFKSQGVIDLTGSTIKTWTDLAANKEQTTTTTFKVKGYGVGEISATVGAIDPLKQTPLSGVTTHLYIFATQEGIFTNNYSPMQLKLDHLDKKLQLGKINLLEYPKERDKILGGGAIESN